MRAQACPIFEKETSVHAIILLVDKIINAFTQKLSNSLGGD